MTNTLGWVDVGSLTRRSIWRCWFAGEQNKQVLRVVSNVTGQCKKSTCFKKCKLFALRCSLQFQFAAAPAQWSPLSGRRRRRIRETLKLAALCAMRSLLPKRLDGSSDGELWYPLKKLQKTPARNPERLRANARTGQLARAAHASAPPFSLGGRMCAQKHAHHWGGRPRNRTRSRSSQCGVRRQLGPLIIPLLTANTPKKLRLDVNL